MSSSPSSAPGNFTSRVFSVNHNKVHRLVPSVHGLRQRSIFRRLMVNFATLHPTRHFSHPISTLARLMSQNSLGHLLLKVECGAPQFIVLGVPNDQRLDCRPTFFKENAHVGHQTPIRMSKYSDGSPWPHVVLREARFICDRLARLLRLAAVASKQSNPVRTDTGRRSAWRETRFWHCAFFRATPLCVKALSVKPSP